MTSKQKITVVFARLAVAPFISSQFEAAFCNVLSGEIYAWKNSQKIRQKLQPHEIFSWKAVKNRFHRRKNNQLRPFLLHRSAHQLYIVLIVSSGLRRQLLSRLSVGPISYGDLSLDIFAERKRQVVRVLLSRCFCHEILIKWKLTCLRKQLDKFLNTQLHFHMFFPSCMYLL